MRLAWAIAAVFSFGTAYAEPVGDILWHKLLAIQSMQAKFHQVMYQKTRVIAKSDGDMAFQRPGLFRWQTKTPTEQLLVADGDKFWLYDVDLEQVTVRPQAPQMSASAGLFLADDEEQLSKHYEVSEKYPDTHNAFLLNAKSKQANIQQMTLTFHENMLLRMEMLDQLGQHTEITFSEIKLNPTLSASLFHFTVPKGVDVVEQ